MNPVKFLGRALYSLRRVFRTVRDAARWALASAIQNAFFVILGASILAVVFGLLMPNLHLDGTATPQHSHSSDRAIMPVTSGGRVGH